MLRRALWWASLAVLAGVLAVAYVAMAGPAR